MVARPSRRRRRHSYKSQGGKVQFLDEDLDHPNRVLLADIIFQAVRQQRPLHPIVAVDEPMHSPSARSLKLPDSNADSPSAESATSAIPCRFHTAWPRNSHSLQPPITAAHAPKRSSAMPVLAVGDG